MQIYHKGFNYSQDGPGNRLVYHLQGCNFRCKWCSNPESLPLTSPEAFEMRPEDVLEEALRSRKLFFDGGGVTFTGGECTLQFDELRDSLRLLRSERINTCIETNASHPKLQELLPFVDHLIADLKLVETDLHRIYTGADNASVLTNLKEVADIGRSFLIRIPLINGVNTDPAPFVQFLRSISTRPLTVEVLRYHEFGKDKWGDAYEIHDGFVTQEQYREFQAALRDAGCEVIET